MLKFCCHFSPNAIIPTNKPLMQKNRASKCLKQGLWCISFFPFSHTILQEKYHLIIPTEVKDGLFLAGERSKNVIEMNWIGNAKDDTNGEKSFQALRWSLLAAEIQAWHKGLCGVLSTCCLCKIPFKRGTEWIVHSCYYFPAPIGLIFRTFLSVFSFLYGLVCQT